MQTINANHTCEPYMHTYLHEFILTYINPSIHNPSTYIYTYIHRYIHTYIHTYMHTYSCFHSGMKIPFNVFNETYLNENPDFDGRSQLVYVYKGEDVCICIHIYEDGYIYEHGSIYEHILRHSYYVYVFMFIFI